MKTGSEKHVREKITKIAKEYYMDVNAIDIIGEDIIVDLLVVIIDDTHQVTAETKVIEGKSVREISNKIRKYIKDTRYWVGNEQNLVISEIGADEFENALYTLGFKTVNNDLQNTNRATVNCWYCYEDTDGSFKYNGHVIFENMLGGKFALKKIQKFINDFEKTHVGQKFRPTKSKHEYNF